VALLGRLRAEVSPRFVREGAAFSA